MVAHRRTVHGMTVAEARSKEFLLASEIDRLLGAAKEGPHGIRDHALLLIMHRHALRVCELVRLRTDKVNLIEGRLSIKRGKGSLDSEEALDSDEVRTLKRYLATREDFLPWLFVSRGQQMRRAMVTNIIGDASKRAGLAHVRSRVLSNPFPRALTGETST